MHNDIDLFDEIIVTESDVLFWLDNVANMKHRTNNARKYYYKNFNVCEKIKESKINGHFEALKDKAINDNQYYEYANNFIDTVYVNESNAPFACPDTFHICDNKQCKVRIKRLRKERNNRYYLKLIKANKVKP